MAACFHTKANLKAVFPATGKFRRQRTGSLSDNPRLTMLILTRQSRRAHPDTAPDLAAMAERRSPIRRVSGGCSILAGSETGAPGQCQDAPQPGAHLTFLQPHYHRASARWEQGGYNRAVLTAWRAEKRLKPF